MGLKETYMVKLVHGLKVHEILLWDQLATQGNLHLLTMTKFCYNIQKEGWFEMKLWYSIISLNQEHKIHILTLKRCGKKSNYNISTTRCCLHYWKGPALMISSKERFVWIRPRNLPPMNSMRFLNNGFQGQLTKTHKWALCISSHIIRWIVYWNSTTLRMLWMVVQGMSIS